MLKTMQNCMIELTFRSDKKYSDPFNDVEVNVSVAEPDGMKKTIPAFWAGGQIWKARYASHKIGVHWAVVYCTDVKNADLNGREALIEVEAYRGDNPLFKHGPLRVSEEGRYLKHKDGKPFFWLGDTWWMGLSKRLEWSADFRRLVDDRADKGFSVIQIVAGLYPDMIPFDKRGENEAGFPWNEDFSRINPAYFDMADRRIDLLVQSGLLPCILGCWGYYIELAGVEVLKKHWRYILARYGAYPVVWCMAGEATMPFYPARNWTKEKNKKYSQIWSDREKKLKYQDFARDGWTEVTAYLRKIDPYKHPITIHAPDYGHTNVNDPSLLDLDMLQSGHGSWNSIPKTVNMIEKALNQEHKMPVIEAEVCYEGMGGSCYADVQRLAFWASMLSGAAGFTYGADGIWQVNLKGMPFGESPQGIAWGLTSWEDAYKLPGSRQLGLAKSFLEKYEWWNFEPHSDWCEPHSKPEDRLAPYAAGIPDTVRIIYMPYFAQKPEVINLERGRTYKAFYYDLTEGIRYEIGRASGDENGRWLPPIPVPVFRDMLLVLERV